jgi:hypothetical protein
MAWHLGLGANLPLPFTSCFPVWSVLHDCMLINFVWCVHHAYMWKTWTFFLCRSVPGEVTCGAQQVLSCGKVVTWCAHFCHGWQYECAAHRYQRRGVHHGTLLSSVDVKKQYSFLQASSSMWSPCILETTVEFSWNFLLNIYYLRFCLLVLLAD